MQRRKWVRWAIGLPLAYVVVWCGLSFAQTLGTVGTLVSSWELKSNGQSLVAKNIGSNLSKTLDELPYPQVQTPFEFTLKGGVVTIEDNGHYYAQSACDCIWSSRLKKLFLIQNQKENDGESGWIFTYDSEKRFQLFYHSDLGIDAATLSLDEEYLTMKLIGRTKPPKATVAELNLRDKGVETFELPTECGVPTRIDSDYYLYAKHGKSSFHSLLTHGEGLVYRWSRKTGVSSQLTTGGTLVGTVAFNGSIWALRQDLNWHLSPLGAMRDRNKMQVLRLDSALSQVLERHEL